MSKYPFLLGCQIAYVASVTITYFFGLEATKAAHSSARTTFGTIRPSLTWVFSLVLGWEHLSWLVTPIVITGFLTVFAGVLIYNNIWIIFPYFRNDNKRKFQHLETQIERIKLQTAISFET